VQIAVVIATYNRRAALARLLDDLSRQDLPPQDAEIVVVVDGSTDGTVEMLRGVESPFALRVLVQENAGQAAARNAGWQAASAPVVLFLDDDLECAPGLLTRHLEVHRGGPGRVAMGRVAMALEGPRSLAYDLLERQLWDWAQRLSDDPRPRWPEDACVATNCSVARSLLEAVQGFDPAFYRALEDWELGLRLWKAGAEFVYACEAMVTQRYDKTARAALHEERWYGRAEILLARKHPECVHRVTVARSMDLPWLRRVLLRMLARVPALSFMVLGLPVALAERSSLGTGLRSIGSRLFALWAQAERLRAAAGESGGWSAFDERFSRHVPVLMYHHVGPPRPGTYPDLTVSPGAFERQIAALARAGYRGLTPAEYLSILRGETALPERAVLVTFDDGYEDIAEHAFPVLARHGFGCVVFVVTGQIAGTNAWDEARGSATHRLLTRDQIRRWSGHGVEFGGHSRTHVSLPTVEVGPLHDEVEGCRSDLEAVTGGTPGAFAYPYGDFDGRSVDAVSKAYPLAFTTVDGLNVRGTDPHLLRRTMVMPADSGFDVLLRARLGYHPRDVILRWRAALPTPLRRLYRAIVPRAQGAA
jgi:peptidoglycan/xylan/chitin deacetylase (PgdA/CDA1 family)/glycosyltransferase involved in cell wall biosynthesis